MTTELTDYIEAGEKKFPRISTRKKLEELGARHLETDKFNLGGVERTIEYMIIEEGYAIVWRRVKNSENYRLYLIAPEVVKFS
ncbi:MAG: hypothetical protein AABX50_01660 [Nanoarchaeota archaeon]